LKEHWTVKLLIRNNLNRNSTIMHLLQFPTHNIETYRKPNTNSQEMLIIVRLKDQCQVTMMH